jgi:TonB family protein
MKAKRILLAATIAGGLLSASALSASVVIDPAPQAGRTEYTAPAPMKIVSPTGIPRRYLGETVRLGLTIDETGQPRNISVLSGRDANLGKQLAPVIAQWKFTPAMKNGRAVPAEVVLPIALVDGAS